MNVCIDCEYVNTNDADVCLICKCVLSSSDKEEGEKYPISTLPYNERYFVKCSECSSRIEIDDINQKEFYCDEDERTFLIDGFINRIDTCYPETEISSEGLTSSSVLVLEEIRTKHKFIIEHEGVFGRYGDFDSDFLLSDENLFGTISGEHLDITKDGNSWFIEWVGRNPTILNNIRLNKCERYRISEGRLRMGTVIFNVSLCI